MLQNNHMGIGLFSIEEKTNYLLRLNEENSQIFQTQEMLRQLHLVKYPTAICAFKCMDGRINLPVITGIPMGIIKPYRNLGGYFEMGWPFLLEKFTSWIQRNVRQGRNCLVLITYHYSASQKELGCAGFNHDQDAAFAFTKKFKQEIQFLYPNNNGVVIPIIIGIETDTDTILFHGENPNDTINTMELLNMYEPDLNLSPVARKIQKIYPNIPEMVRLDLTETIVLGNILHISHLKKNPKKTQDLTHQECIICVGRGFEWLHTPNMALIVGPFSPELSHPIKKAAAIIEKNIKNETIKNGFILLSSAGYFNTGLQKNIAILKSDNLATMAERIIKEHSQELFGQMKTMRSVVDKNTLKLHTFLKL